MTKPVAYFAIGTGMPGYMPNSIIGHYAVTTRREVAEALRDAASLYDFPASVVRQVSLKRLWQHAKRHGLSSVSLELQTPSMGAEALLLMGLTEAEYEEYEASQDD